VRAPLGGIVVRKDGAGGNQFVELRIRLNGNNQFISFNHIQNIDNNVQIGYSVAPGEHLGEIYSGGHFGNSRANHTHFHYNGSFARFDATTMNGLLIFDEPRHRDPQSSGPLVEDTNCDFQPVRFKVGPHQNNYLPDDGKVFGPVDIVVEVTDHQSVDAPWQVPQHLGYYIQKIDGATTTDIVRSSADPYILMNGTNWYGRPVHNTDLKVKSALIDTVAALEAKVPFVSWPRWFTYIVTNTSMRFPAGDIRNLDTLQCWATNAKQVAGQPANGYVANYDTARIIKDAKFPDGQYRVQIRAGDFVNQARDYAKDVQVDNFRPYVKEVEILANGLPIYSAKWEWNGAQLSLNPNNPDNAMTGSAKVDKDVIINATTSEPMNNLFIEDIQPLACGQLDAVSVNAEGTRWNFVLTEDKIPDDGSKNGKQIIHFRGTDKADNSIMEYTDAKTTYTAAEIPKKQADGSWSVAPANNPDDREDTVHRFKIGGVDVAFVIDVSGSMVEENIGIKNALNNVLAAFPPDAGLTFQLISFADDVFVGSPTDDLSEIRRQVSGLSATGGDACPEASIESINAIAKDMIDNGEIFLATDASPYPGAKYSATAMDLKARGVKLSTILSGDCKEELFAANIKIPEFEELKKSKPFKPPSRISSSVFHALTLSDSIKLSDEDFRKVLLPFSFPFGGKTYSSIYVNSNGFITFEEGSTGYECVNCLLSGPPRIIGFWHDLNPDEGGTINLEQVENDFYIKFDRVPKYGTTNNVTFTIILRPDGTFAVVYGENTIPYGLAGFSVGRNVSDPGELDLSGASQPIQAAANGTVYELFENDNDLVNLTLEYAAVTYEPPRFVTGVEVFLSIARETGGLFAYVPEVQSANENDIQRYENTFFNLVQGGITQSIAFAQPSTGPVGATMAVTITGSGTDFQSGTFLAFEGDGVTVTGFDVISSSQLQATIQIDAGASLGFRDIIAITPLTSGETDTVRGIGAFEIIDAYTSPTIVGISPTFGNGGQTLTVTVYGMNTTFDETSELYMGEGITVLSTNALSPQILQASINICSAAKYGFHDVSVFTGVEYAYARISGPFFVYTTSPEFPAIVSVSPSFGLPGDTLLIEINSANTSFVEGISEVSFSGAGIEVLSVSVTNSTMLTAEIRITGDAMTEYRDVRVTTGTEISELVNGFLVTTEMPKASFTTAVMQNPAASKYCDIVVVSDLRLKRPPEVKAWTTTDTMDVAMSLIPGTEEVYKGPYEFVQEGPHSISTRLCTISGIDTTHTRSFNVALLKPGFDGIITSLDDRARLRISKYAVKEKTYFLADYDAKKEETVYHFGPVSSFDHPFQLGISYDQSRYSDPSKLFIYREEHGQWLRLSSRVFAETNEVQAEVNQLGKFKIGYDATFTSSNLVMADYALFPNYPNPFNPTTAIEYCIPKDAYVEISVFNVLGQKVKTLFDGNQVAGRHAVIWDASELSSGVYLYRMKSGEFTQIRKMVLMQ
jgi:hypothetical protein